MANKKISQLTAKGTALAATDLVEIAEDNGVGGYVTKSVTGANIVSGLQPTLVSGTDIVTINSTSLLGSGDLALQTPLVSGTDIVSINSASLLGSGNINLQTPLVSGTDIKTVNSTSLLGSGNVAVQATLVSGTNIKTINSTTLLGSGDLVIGSGVHILTKPVSGRTYSVRTDSSAASSSAVSAANTIYLSPFVPANSLTISNLQINVVSLAVGASARILVYSDSNGVPTTKLIESTTLDCSTSGAKTYTTSYTFTAGTTYWLGVYTNNASFQMSTISLANTIPISTNAFSSAYTSVTAAATFASAPTTLGTATLATGSMYVINLTAA